MVLIINRLCSINKIRQSSSLLFDRGFFIVIGYKISIIAESEGRTPEKEPINPPSYSISVLL
jgi:hypothetical protein